MNDSVVFKSKPRPWFHFKLYKVRFKLNKVQFEMKPTKFNLK